MKTLRLVLSVALLALAFTFAASGVAPSRAKAEYFPIHWIAQIMQRPMIYEALKDRVLLASRYESLDFPDGRKGMRLLIEASPLLHSKDPSESAQFCVFSFVITRDPKAENPNFLHMDSEKDKTDCGVLKELPTPERNRRLRRSLR